MFTQCWYVILFQYDNITALSFQKLTEKKDIKTTAKANRVTRQQVHKQRMDAATQKQKNFKVKGKHMTRK